MFVALFLAGLLACQGPTDVGPAALATTEAPSASIVVFHRSVSDPAGLARRLAGPGLRHVYTHAIKGFAADLPSQAIEALKRNPNVAYIEPDGLAYAITVQSPAPSWGLDRIDQRSLPLSNSYTYLATGTGVNAYIIDTGIRTTHQDFGGRALWRFNSAKGRNAGGDTDCNGHGTHVAGTVGGTKYGVAKGVRLHAVKVLDCAGDGRWSWVIAGIDWVTANAVKPAVANMSLGGDFSQAVNDAVAGSIASGISYSIAAGNSATNACTVSPASVASALTVAASTKTDGHASYSNAGSCVDLYAPGSGILSDWASSDIEAVFLSGTSMAAPHVSGAVALWLETHTTASPAAVTSAILGGATTGVLTGVPAGTPNRLLFTVQGGQLTSGTTCLPRKKC
jgi:aqualysin 1